MEREKPKMMRVAVQNEDGSVEHKTVRADSVKTGTAPRHQSLPADLTERATKLYPRVGNVLRPTLAKWLDGFLYDQNPDKEIAVWEKIAAITDELWIDQPKQIAALDRKSLTLTVIAVSTGMVDIPSQIKGVTDQHVALVREAYSAA